MNDVNRAIVETNGTAVARVFISDDRKTRTFVLRIAVLFKATAETATFLVGIGYNGLKQFSSNYVTILAR